MRRVTGSRVELRLLGSSGMKLKFVVYLCALLTAMQAAAGAESFAAPDFVLKSTGGENIRLSEYRGQIVMLSFWASWCGDCRSQLEDFAELRARYRDSGFEVLAVSLDTRIDQAAETAATLGIEYPVLHDAGGLVGREYDVDTMPFVVLIDREGAVRQVLEGYRRNRADEFFDHVRDLLRE